MYTVKRAFTVPDFIFEAGISLPVNVGYETYGTLAPDKSNAILICHYFSGTSHAGGNGYEIHNSDGSVDKFEEMGWWAPLIGPGLPFDTNHYFIICIDVISNVNANHPHVLTTGPSTINPFTGMAYGLEFPQITIRDFVKLQKVLLESLGIFRLYCVAGPSMGGMQALQWAVDYPQFVERVIAVVSTGRTSSFTSINPLQLGIDSISIDPEQGIHTAVKAMTIQAYSYILTKELWPHEIVHPCPSGDRQRLTFHEKVNEIVQKRVQLVNPYNWLYISRVCQLYTLESGYDSFDSALGRIQAKVLAIPSSSDLIFPASESKYLIDRLQALGKTAYYKEWCGLNGHIEAITNCGSYANTIREFLNDLVPGELT